MFLPLKSLISEVVILAPYYHAYIEFSKQNSKIEYPQMLNRPYLYGF